MNNQTYSIGTLLKHKHSRNMYKITSVKSGPVYEIQELGPLGTKQLISHRTLERRYIVNEKAVQKQCESKLSQEEHAGSSTQGYGEISEECPIQPAIPKTSAAAHSSRKEMDPQVIEMRRELISYAQTLSDSVEVINNLEYTALKDKQNFAKINKTKSRFTVNIKLQALNERQLDMCKIYPKDYGWSLRAAFVVLDRSDLPAAKELIRASWQYITTGRSYNNDRNNDKQR